MCVGRHVGMCELRRVYTEKKTGKRVVKQGDSGKLMAPRKRPRKTHTHTHTHTHETISCNGTRISAQCAVFATGRDLARHSGFAR